MMFQTAAGILLMAILFSSCTVSAVLSEKATSNIMQNKLIKFDGSTTKQDVFKELGPPAFSSTISTDSGNVEVFGFEVKHIWYGDLPVAIFKNDRFVGVVTDSYELMRVLSTLRVIPGATFWREEK